jgi:hypothetical protein
MYLIELNAPKTTVKKSKKLFLQVLTYGEIHLNVLISTLKTETFLENV